MEELKNVDAILVVKNELLKRIYPDFKISEAFKEADRAIGDQHSIDLGAGDDSWLVNLDFNDVKTAKGWWQCPIITESFLPNEEDSGGYGACPQFSSLEYV